MTIWPVNLRNTSWFTLGVMLLSASVAYAYTFVLEPASLDSFSSELFRYLISGLIGIIIVMLKMGYTSINNNFKQVLLRMDNQDKDFKALVEVVRKHGEDIVRIQTRCDERHNGGV